MQNVELTRAPRNGGGSDTVDDRLQDFAATMGGWFWETDAAFRFTYMSPSVFDITGVPAQWHYGKTREEIGIAKSVTPEVWQAHIECLRRREPFSNFIYQRSGPDGIKWMRTNGRPVFDHYGQFQGYRGTATEVTAEVEAQRRNDSLIGAIENLDEIFVLWDADDRLVICNQRFREINAQIVAGCRPGILFEEHVRMAMEAGVYTVTPGQEENWVQDRLARHRNPGAPFEVQRQDGRWIMLSEQRLPDGSTTSISADISKLKRAEQALAEQNDILEAALSTIPDGVQVLDRDLNLVAWNDRLFELVDLDKSTILKARNPGKALRQALAERREYGSVEIHTTTEAQDARASSSVPFQHEQQLANGRWVECRVRPTASGGYLTVYRDINESKRLYKRLEILASTDALTQVGNRGSFMDRAAAEFGRADRYDRNISILMIDVDHFKAVNDNHGHATGDDVLRQVAAACNGALRGSDILGRIGGEEFGALLPETDTETAHLVAERLRRDVADLTIETKSGAISVTISIGVATASRDDSNLETTMAQADEALYQAKRQGRNKVVFTTNAAKAAD